MRKLRREKLPDFPFVCVVLPSITILQNYMYPFALYMVIALLDPNPYTFLSKQYWFQCWIHNCLCIWNQQWKRNAIMDIHIGYVCIHEKM